VNPTATTCGGGISTSIQQVASTLSGATAGAKGAASGKSGQACASDALPTIPTDCSTLTPASYKALEAQLKTAGAALTCEQGTFNSIQQNLSCVQNADQALYNQTQQNQSLLSTWLASAKNGPQCPSDTCYTQRQNDLANQTTTVGTMLGKYQAAFAAVQTLFNTVSAQATTASNTYATEQQKIESIHQDIVTTTMGDMKACFTEAAGQNSDPLAQAAPLRCPQSNALVSPAQFVQCEVNYITMGGNVGGQVTAAGGNASSNIQSLLNQILGATPSNTQVPQTAAQFQQIYSQNYLVQQLSDISAGFGTQLAAYNSMILPNGMSVANFINQYINFCEKVAAQAVANQITDATNGNPSANSPLGQEIFAEQQAEIKNQNDTRTLLVNNFTQFSNAMSSVPGVAFSLPTYAAQCQSTTETLNLQASCLSNLSQSANDLLSNTSSGFTFPISNQIQVQYAETKLPSEPSTCTSLSDCVTSLTNFQKDLGDATNSWKQAHSTFISQVTSQGQSYFNNLNQATNTQYNALKAEVQQLNQQMASLGATSSLTYKVASLGTFAAGEAGQDGSPGFPTFTPGDPSATSDNLADFTGLSSIQTALQTKQTNLATAQSGLDSQEATCQGVTTLGSVSSSINTFNTQCPSTYVQDCSTDTSNQVGQLLATLSGLENLGSSQTQGLATAAYNNLSGYPTACATTTKSATAWTGFLQNIEQQCPSIPSGTCAGTDTTNNPTVTLTNACKQAAQKFITAHTTTTASGQTVDSIGGYCNSALSASQPSAVLVANSSSSCNQAIQSLSKSINNAQSQLTGTSAGDAN
jgi:hypothetical protein